MRTRYCALLLIGLAGCVGGDVIEFTKWAAEHEIAKQAGEREIEKRAGESEINICDGKEHKFGDAVITIGIASATEHLIQIYGTVRNDGDEFNVKIRSLTLRDNSGQSLRRRGSDHFRDEILPGESYAIAAIADGSFSPEYRLAIELASGEGNDGSIAYQTASGWITGWQPPKKQLLSELGSGEVKHWPARAGRSWEKAERSALARADLYLAQANTQPQTSHPVVQEAWKVEFLLNDRAAELIQEMGSLVVAYQNETSLSREEAITEACNQYLPMAQFMLSSRTHPGQFRELLYYYECVHYRKGEQY